MPCLAIAMVCTHHIRVGQVSDLFSWQLAQNCTVLWELVLQGGGIRADSALFSQVLSEVCSIFTLISSQYIRTWQYELLSCSGKGMKSNSNTLYCLGSLLTPILTQQLERRVLMPRLGILLVSGSWNFFKS